MKKSIEYYEQNAQAFIDGTINVDMTELYERFLPRLPQGGKILDAGCGSGRDAAEFRKRGFAVSAFDASPTIAAEAEKRIGVAVEVATFVSYRSEELFDGIWACASLLHVPLAELPASFDNLANHLRPGGVIYASFKYGTGEREHNGRFFTNLDEFGLQELVSDLPGMLIEELWLSGDRRAGRENECWLNACIVKDLN